MRETLTDILAVNGHEVLSAGDGQEAVDRTSGEDGFDTVLMDIVMPRKNGVEALGEIRRLHPDLPVILMTGYSVPDLIDEAQRLGCRVILPKPLDIPRLLSLL